MYVHNIIAWKERGRGTEASKVYMNYSFALEIRYSHFSVNFKSKTNLTSCGGVLVAEEADGL